jgi:molybdopterin converting factor small subunit
MALVHLSLEQRRFCGGATEVEVEANTVQQLITELEADFPGIGVMLESSAVAINGEFVNDPSYEPLPAGAEIYFLPKVAGGLFAL